jgi:ribosomal protein S5
MRDLCFAAGIESVAADYIKSNTPVETARAQLIAAKAEDGPEIVTAITDLAGRPGNPALGMWGATIEKFGGKS